MEFVVVLRASEEQEAIVQLRSLGLTGTIRGGSSGWLMSRYTYIGHVGAGKAYRQ